MKYTLLFSDEAFYDLSDACDFYKNVVSEKTENNFKEEIRLGINYLQENPLNLAVKYKNVRIYNLKHFPFQIHFLIKEDTILVIGIFHGRSNPISWTDRIKS